MQKSGTIQMVFTPAKKLQIDKSAVVPEVKMMADKKEGNRLIKFKGLLQLFKGMTAAYRSGCDKAYVFFDKQIVK